MFLIMAAHCKKPESEDLKPITSKLIALFGECEKFKDRSSKYINYMNVLEEIIRGSSWPCVVYKYNFRQWHHMKLYKICLKQVIFG